MTKFRSRLLGGLAGFLVLALAGCETSSGVRVPTIASKDVAAAYIPLHKVTHLGIDSDEGAAMALTSGIAVTCAHNANLLAPHDIIGEARDYDLLFFRTGRSAQVPTAPVQVGAAVTAYGQGADAELRLARGVVRAIQTCPGCAAAAYFTFSNSKRGASDAGPGFSGGPVLDANGRLIGITFGYKDTATERLIYAYDMARVREELKRAVRNLPRDLD